MDGVRRHGVGVLERAEVAEVVVDPQGRAGDLGVGQHGELGGAGLGAPGEGDRQVERGVIVLGSMEATLTPLMEAVEAEHPGVKVYSLPSVDHPQWGRHIDLGVKGPPDLVPAAFARLREGLEELGVKSGPEVVRN